jgi:hypothetical protein
MLEAKHMQNNTGFSFKNEHSSAQIELQKLIVEKPPREHEFSPLPVGDRGRHSREDDKGLPWSSEGCASDTDFLYISDTRFAVFVDCFVRHTMYDQIRMSLAF